MCFTLRVPPSADEHQLVFGRLAALEVLEVTGTVTPVIDFQQQFGDL
jgi:hypothetical protein